MVGAQLWIRRQTAARLLEEAGVKIRRQGLDSEQLTEAVRLYPEGWSCRRLGERFGVDHDCSDACAAVHTTLPSPGKSR